MKKIKPGEEGIISGMINGYIIYFTDNTSEVLPKNDLLAIQGKDIRRRPPSWFEELDERDKERIKELAA